MDFSLKTYQSLLAALKEQNYTLQTFQEFILNPVEKSIVMRHDVDRLPENALRLAELEERFGVKGSYYFRVVKQSFDADIIKGIAEMGHEIGYHYENLSAVARRKDFRKPEIRNPKSETLNRKQETGVRSQEEVDNSWESTQNSKLKTQNSIFELALEDFKRNLNLLRKIVPIRTICMHGSPLSKIDNRDLWKVYNYHDYGIIGEPYFDVDFNEVLYLTDTGRRWDGKGVSIRDKVSWPEARGQGSGEEPSFTSKPLTANHSPAFLLPNSLHSTKDIINAINEGLMPDKIMINVHPQRWTDKPVLWVKELVWQSIKNVIKRMMVNRQEARG